MEPIQEPMIQLPFFSNPIPRKFILIGAGVAAFLIILILVLLNLRQKSSQNPITSTNEPESNIVASVGKQKISQQDLDYELSRYSPSPDDSDRKVVLDKMVNDSVTLQANSVTPAPDYTERLKQVEEAKASVINKSQTITGTVISVWFYNEWIGPLGYDASKQLALAKITDVHTKVKNHQLTIEQAGETLRNDFAMKQLSLQYKTNSILTFNADRSKIITFSPEFNSMLWNLKEGEVSDIYLAKDQQPDPTAGVPAIDSDDNNVKYVDIDAVYMFGQVSKKSSDSQVINYDDWLEKQKQNYEIKIY